MPKKRLDLLLVERSLAPSREKAQRLILAGQVLVADEPVTKPGHSISIELPIRLREQEHPYVSRGALKLEKALQSFQILCQRRIALDVGASTGGFTQILLLHGAAKVHALDVGYGQLDWKIRSDPRVVVYEKKNARYLTFADIGEKVDLITIDVSFISLLKVMPALIPLAHAQTDWVTLIKPQFELGRDKVGKGGIVTSTNDHELCVQQVTQCATSQGWIQQGVIESPILGMDGNREFLAHWRYEFSHRG